MERASRKRAGPERQDDHSRKIFRNTLQGQSAWERHQIYVSRYLKVYERNPGSDTSMRKLGSSSRNRNDWDILKERHRFLREDNDTSVDAAATSSSSSSYEDEVARRYYDHLFKEYAIADMKHYKSGTFALRWRSESDVIDGIGQFTCANTRCEHHRQIQQKDEQVILTPFEMTFAYEEANSIKGEKPVLKSALVKVVLCPRCARKLRYKSDKEREQHRDDLRSRTERQSSKPSERRR